MGGPYGRVFTSPSAHAPPTIRSTTSQNAPRPRHVTSDSRNRSPGGLNPPLIPDRRLSHSNVSRPPITYHQQNTSCTEGPEAGSRCLFYYLLLRTHSIIGLSGPFSNYSKQPYMRLSIGVGAQLTLGWARYFCPKMYV